MKKMWIIMCAFFLFTVGVGMVQPVHTAILERFSESEDAQAIMDREEYILKGVRSIATDCDLEDQQAICISYEKAVKAYVDLDIFSSANLTEEELKVYMENATYVWLVPVYIQGKTYMLTLSKGLPVRDEVRAILTDEEIRQLEDEVGKWIAPEIAEWEFDFDYQSIIDEALAQNDLTEVNRVYVLGGTAGYRRLSAVVFQNGECYFIPLDNTENQDAVSEIPVYSFETIKEEAEKNPLKEGETGGQGTME